MSTDTRTATTLLAVTALVAVFLYLVSTIGADADYSHAGLGTEERTDTVRVFALAVVAEERGTGSLVGTLLNTGPSADRLTHVTVSGRRVDAPARLPAPVTLPTGRLVKLHHQPLDSVRSPAIRPGFMVSITMTFEHSGPLTTRVPVTTPRGPYQGFDPVGRVVP